MERTFCIIKPDAVARNLQGEILAMIQGAGLRVVAMKQIRMTRQQAEGFYAVHKERPFFASLTEYMSSGLWCAPSLKATRPSPAIGN